jgi:hypothetical protein
VINMSRDDKLVDAHRAADEDLARLDKDLAESGVAPCWPSSPTDPAPSCAERRARCRTHRYTAEFDVDRGVRR